VAGARGDNDDNLIDGVESRRLGRPPVVLGWGGASGKATGGLGRWGGAPVLEGTIWFGRPGFTRTIPGARHQCAMVTPPDLRRIDWEGLQP
jgi:hypothetical protein